MEQFRKTLLYVRLAMPVLFVSIGIYCLINARTFQLEPIISRLFGALLIVYGIFRGYRAWKDIKDHDA